MSIGRMYVYSFSNVAYERKLHKIGECYHETLSLETKKRDNNLATKTVEQDSKTKPNKLLLDRARQPEELTSSIELSTCENDLDRVHSSPNQFIREL